MLANCYHRAFKSFDEAAEYPRKWGPKMEVFDQPLALVRYTFADGTVLSFVKTPTRDKPTSVTARTDIAFAMREKPWGEADRNHGDFRSRAEHAKRGAVVIEYLFQPSEANQ